MHVHSSMMTAMLKLFLYHVSRDTQLGIALRATLETMQLEVGSSSSAMTIPYYFLGKSDLFIVKFFTQRYYILRKYT